MEYLFRGKSTPKEGNCEFDNTWVYGDLIHNRGKTYIHPTGNAFMTDGELSRLMVTHEVVPETVGMYTGFIDGYDKKIFEGDICVICNYQGYTSEKFVVQYEKPTTRFFLTSYNDDSGDLIDFENIGRDNIKVVGNITEPPDMIKFKGEIKTNIVGSECEFEFEVEAGTPKEEIEKTAKEAAFNNIDWWYDEGVWETLCAVYGDDECENRFEGKSDEEIQEAFENLEWKEAILVHITTATWEAEEDDRR